MLIRIRPFIVGTPQLPTVPTPKPLHRSHFSFSSSQRPLTINQFSVQNPKFVASANRRPKTLTKPQKSELDTVVDDDDDDEEADGDDEGGDLSYSNGFKGLEVEGDERGEGDEFSYSSGRGNEKDYDRDPEFGDIIGSCFDDPSKAQARVEERIRRKRSKILQTKTGSAVPTKVVFNGFNFSNTYIWFEFYHAPLTKDISLICDAIRSWHIIGRLGGCNSMNMQLSQSPLDNKRPSYDAIQGANVTPTTFYNIGDLEVQDNIARIWVDIGTSEPILLDVLINALTCISSDYVGIKQLTFGGKEFENWKENFTSEDPGCSIHKI